MPDQTPQISHSGAPLRFCYLKAIEANCASLDALPDAALASWRARPYGAAYGMSGLVLLPACPGCGCAVGDHSERGCEADASETERCSCRQKHSRLVAGVRVS